MKLILVILLLCSCSTTKHRGSRPNIEIITTDTVHMEIRKDSLGYDSTMYKRTETRTYERPKFFKERHSIWAILVVVLAILIKVYVN